MGVTVKYSDPINPPIERVTITGTHEQREIVVRKCASSDDPKLRTIECSYYGTRIVQQFKWAATLDAIEAFGTALVRMAKEGKAAL